MENTVFMMHHRRSNLVQPMALTILLLTVCFLDSRADVADSVKRPVKIDKNYDVLQRTYRRVFDIQDNAVSNFAFKISNYGIWGFDIASGRGGGYWPRGSQNQYMFAGGSWFGAQKRNRDSTIRKLCLIGYNPNSGDGWCVPGAIADGAQFTNTTEGLLKNRLYFSTDFSTTDGEVFPPDPTLPKWPIWDTSPTDTIRVNRYFGRYVNDVDARSNTFFPKGPSFISGEDIVCVYKDTDLSRYEGGLLQRRNEGYPLGLQIEQTVYSWGFGDYADFIFMKYMFIHPEQFQDTLLNCWMGAVLDVDIAHSSNLRFGAENDRSVYYKEDPGLNLALQWTNGDRGEAGRGFGYLGFNFLESPAVDADGFIRKDKKRFEVPEQLGLVTVQDWPILEDRRTNEERYDFLAARTKPEGASVPGDRRMLMSTGPFNMRPGDSARIVLGVILAKTGKGGDADGTPEDMVEIIRKVRFAQTVYDANFLAPQPPDRSLIVGYDNPHRPFEVPSTGFRPLDNGMIIQWDSTAELSVDSSERGLDFLGYRIYRARNVVDLDTFSQNRNIDERKGPQGWKQIAQFALATPFVKQIGSAEQYGAAIDDFVPCEQSAAGETRFLVLRTASLASPWLEMWDRLLRPLGRPEIFLYARTGNGRIDLSRLSRADSMAMCYLIVPDNANLPVVRPVNPQTVPADSLRVYAANLFFNLNDVRAWRERMNELIQARSVRMEEFLFSDIIEYDSAGVRKQRVIRRPWQELTSTRHEVIAPYMARITNGRTFVDYGDDNQDGVVLYSADPNASERLINNVDYYYGVRAYDEGDYLLPTFAKLNDLKVSLTNSVRARPRAPRLGGDAPIEVVIPDDQISRLSGIHNIRFQINDQNRFKQQYGGRTLKLEFYRAWGGPAPLGLQRPAMSDYRGLYQSVFILRDSATNRRIGAWSSVFRPSQCDFAPVDSIAYFPGYFTERGFSWVGADSVRIDTISFNPLILDTNTMGTPDSRQKARRRGAHSTSASCEPRGAWFAEGLVGVSFDYEMEQWGGDYRFDFARIESGNSQAYVGETNATTLTYTTENTFIPPSYFDEPPIPDVVQHTTSGRFARVFPSSYNNGPGLYEIEFLPGGTETITTDFLQTGSATGPVDNAVFENVPFLNMRVRNIIPFTRTDETGATIDVTKNEVFTPANLSILTDIGNYPELLRTPPGSFAAAAYGWRNTRPGLTAAQRSRSAAQRNTGEPLGRPDRYYLSRNLSRTGTDTLDFAHVLNIAGVQVALDFSWVGRKSSSFLIRPTSIPAPSPLPNRDFQAGDKVLVGTFGGALGFPEDNAHVFLRVGQTDPEVLGREITSDDLEAVQVVPNPYIVTHEGIRSSFEGRIYFTKLPRRATIRIFTTSGNLVRTIEHDESTSTDPDQQAVLIWDLFSSNRQRVASQLLVAEISTPSGAKVIRKFSVIVGPARLISNTN
jgi:hypothetical protein